MGWGLITLTHVCHRWRTIFISRSSLWSCLDCKNVDKTRTYIERSKAGPLNICLRDPQGDPYTTKEAVLLAVPRMNRLKYLTIMTNGPADILDYFDCRAPSLEKLEISLNAFPPPVLSDALLGGDLSSLRELSLAGVITRLAWKDLSNLTTLTLRRIPLNRISVTQLLDFFESAPLLHTIVLVNSLPLSSNAPPARTVSLNNLKKLSIDTKPPHSILLNHLSIPTGALLVLEFEFGGDASSFLNYFPKPSKDIKPLSPITAINLLFDVVEKLLRLDGPSGGTYIFGHRTSGWNTPSHTVDRRILQSLDQSILSTTKRLAISKLKLPTPVRVDKCQAFRTLYSLTDLCVLTLTRCHNLPFILALDPRRTPSNLVTCPKLEELVLYIEEPNGFHITEMLDMVEARALRGAKLSSIMIVGLGELMPGKEAFKLRKHVTRVDYRVEDVPPDWDILPGEVSYGDYMDE